MHTNMTARRFKYNQAESNGKEYYQFDDGGKIRILGFHDTHPVQWVVRGVPELEGMSFETLDEAEIMVTEALQE